MKQELKLNPELTKQHLSTRIFKSYLWFLRRYHPTIDLEQLSSEAGLPLEYITDETNWVSVIFDYRFTTLCIEKTRVDDLCYRVGQVALSEELLGKTIYLLMKYGLTLESVYNNTPKIAARFSKVTELQVMKHGYGSTTMRLHTNHDGLTQDEQSALRSNLTNIIRNTEGYAAGAALLHGPRPARVEVQESPSAGGWSTFEFHIRYSSQWRQSQRLLFSAFAAVFSLIVGMNWSWVSTHLLLSASSGIATLSALLCASVFTKFRRLNKAFSDTDQTLQKMDDQYLALQVAKESLQRRFQESQLIHKISDNLTKVHSRKEVLDQSCNDIVKTLNYDRALILLSDAEERELKYGASRGGNEPLDTLLKSFKQPIAIPSDDPQKISNVFRNSTPFLIEDVASILDTLNPESKLILTATQSKSFLCVPISSDERKHGVLCVDYYTQQKRLTACYPARSFIVEYPN